LAENVIRVLIVDDEAPARALLREYLGADPRVEVVGECMNGFEAVKRIGELAPDLVFLDVQMPKLDGFEVLELLERPPVVVFVTAYDEYALRAFVGARGRLRAEAGRPRAARRGAEARARASHAPRSARVGSAGCGRERRVRAPPQSTEPRPAPSPHALAASARRRPGSSSSACW
jgi:two-component system LytT family response regulator